jgi:predicted nucleic acid-binding protein
MPLIPRAYVIASKARIGIYDCLYVALAERVACDLITGDTHLINAIGPIYPRIVDLAALP